MLVEHPQRCVARVKDRNPVQHYVLGLGCTPQLRIIRGNHDAVARIRSNRAIVESQAQ
jgi:hypothetical protein